MSKLSTTAGKIFGGFLGDYLFLTTIFWVCGVIINNAYLSNYGAFSWHILDIGYLSSGLLFAGIICLIILPFIIKKFSSIFCENQENIKCFWNRLRFSSLIIALYILVILFLSFLLIFYNLKFEICTCIFFILSSILVIATLFIIAYFIYHDLKAKNEKKDDKDIFNDFFKQELDNIQRHYKRNNIKAHSVGSYYFVKVNENRYKLLNELFSTKEKFDKLRFNKIFTFPKSYYLFSPFLFIFAFFFGREIYQYIPKALGGGKPEIIQFFHNEKLEGIVDYNKSYELLDETPNEYIVHDPIKDFVIFVPHEHDKNGPIKFLNEHINQVTISFAADLHLCTDSVKISDRKAKSINDFDKLANYWNRINAYQFILLGDILEAPDVNDTAIDSAAYDSLLNAFYAKYRSLHNRCKTDILIGNNDARDTSQLLKFRSKLDLQQNVETCIEWHKEINENVYAISIFLPHKIYFDNYDRSWFYKVIDSIPVSLGYILDQKHKHYKYILVLTHEGFIRDSHWFTGYKFEEDSAFIYDPSAIRKWETLTKKVKDTLEYYDKDHKHADSILPQIIVISGHYHKGTVLRSMDGIDHIICPSFHQGERDSELFDKGSYPIMNLHFNLTEPESVEVVFKSLGSDSNIPKDIRSTLYFN